MKAFILGLFMSMGLNNESKTVDYTWVLEEMNAEVEVASDLQLPENTIWVFDLTGNPVGQYSQEQFINGKLSLTEVQEILDSEFLFDFNGDSYYLIP